ncbi:LysR family transcriptional regulator [Paraburkholderia sp. J7]|uniref:LysR family transcriptional regulator n=1 Tax=Paraburkholderia sp. J7 TaxID=2805438 RepID=UPI002AB6BE4A|nr:LysR family transcriptional regulator [Paraburkholderia sp. J7]
MDRLKVLSVFKAIADNGSFVGAASALDIPTSAASNAVQDLEKLIGVRLLHRTTRRLAFTSVGEEVLRRIEVLLQSYEELASVGQLSVNEPIGTIRMAATASFARYYLGPALATFRVRYPKVDVDIQLCEGAVSAVLEEVDLALCLADDLRATQIARPLGNAEVGIYAAPDYLADRGEPTHPWQLVQHDCLTFRAAGPGATWSFEPLDHGDPCKVNVKGALHANQIEVLADAAAHGAGIAMLPAFVARGPEVHGKLRRILRGWHVAPLLLQLAYSSRRYQPMAVRKLIEHLIETVGAAVEHRTVSPLRPAGGEVTAVNGIDDLANKRESCFPQHSVDDRLATA